MIKRLLDHFIAILVEVSGTSMLARSPGLSLAALLLLCACAGIPAGTPSALPQPPQSRPVVAGVDDQISVRAMSVRLPPGAGWEKRELPMPDGGVLLEFERSLASGNRVQIHIADYFGHPRVLPLELAMSGRSDMERLAMFLMVVGESAARFKGRRQSEWVEMQRGPQRRFNAACREKHELREERAENGNLYLWQDWMFFCVDPVSHIPIQTDYAERYPAEGGTVSPTFTEDAAAFFDSIEFRAADLTTRPVAEVSAAFVQANNNLFSNIDREDYAATVVFSLDPNVKDPTLLNLAHRLFKLKGTSPQNPSENAIAKHLTDERAFFTRFILVPESMSKSGNVFIGDLMIHRALLPKGHLGKGSGYGEFLLRIRAYPATEHNYRLEHVGIQRLK